jgi:hypothetical protein
MICSVEASPDTVPNPKLLGTIGIDVWFFSEHTETGAFVILKVKKQDYYLKKSTQHFVCTILMKDTNVRVGTAKRAERSCLP